MNKEHFSDALSVARTCMGKQEDVYNVFGNGCFLSGCFLVKLSTH